MAGVPEQPEWTPHAEKQWGQLSHTLAKHLPGRMLTLRRTGNSLRALPGAKRRKGKG